MVALGPSAAWMPLDEKAEVGEPARPSAAAAAATALRVVTWNVEYRTPAARLIDALRSEPALAAADVLLLQEIGPDRRGGPDRSARIAAALGLGFVYAHGLAIAARWRLREAALMALPAAALPYNRRRRVALAATVESAVGPIRLVTVHLDTRLNLAERAAQLAPALADLPARAIVGGDLNTLPFRFAAGALPIGRADQAGGLDAFLAERGFALPARAAGATHRTGLRLDAIYARGCDAAPAQVLRTVRVSDHFPLWCDVTLDPPRSRP